MFRRPSAASEFEDEIFGFAPSPFRLKEKNVEYALMRIQTCTNGARSTDCARI